VARSEVSRGTAAAGPVLLTCAVTAVALLVAGCSGGEPDAPEASTTTVPPSPAATSAAATASPTTSVPAFDCQAVDAAQDALDGAYAAELDRLDVHRGDPRAQAVYALVTTTQGPAYYAAVLAAAPEELRADAQQVLDYYRRLSAQVGDLTVDSGSERALADAMDRLDDATVALDPSPAAGSGGSQVVAAQERLQAGVERSCAGAGATPTSSGASPTSSTATAGAASTTG
jgi:hypothetical protein